MSRAVESQSVSRPGAARASQGEPERRGGFGSLLVFALALIAAAPARSAPTFEDLVDCRWAVEEVLWRHRIWPEQNPGPKPALAELLSRAAVERKLDDALRQTAALEERFHSKLDAAVLRHELERMARDSKDPAMLRELFAAAGSGEHAALCLALPSVARNRLDAFYSNDSEIHRALREEAEEGLARAPDFEGLAAWGAEVEVTTVERARDAGEAERGIGERGQLLLDDDAWRDQIASLARSFDGGPLPTPWTGPSVAIDRAGQLPVGRRSRLEETRELFRVRELREASDDRLLLATAVWRKRPMDAWWAEERKGFRRAEPEVETLELPAVTATDCVDDTWSPTRNDSPPSKRYHHVAVWTGSEMIVWGGSIETVKYNDGRLYSPATDSWNTLDQYPQPYGAPPFPRHTATAVWTGTEMIVWGGYDTDYLDDGGRYSPTARVWTDYNNAGAPTKRTWHTAVWSGTEMIVWGGYNGSYLGDGKRYDAANNLWLAMPFGSEPLRAYHSAVWAGDRMIVWGGRDAAIARNDGSEYFPPPPNPPGQIGSWVPLPTVNAPAKRYDHTAVWTGAEMIVWGGYDGAPLDTGGRYTPGAGWSATPVSTAGAPSARRYHRAVWAGAPVNRMIVWGGYDGSLGLGNGKLYDPGTNGWTAMSSTGAPEPRWGHSLVWTGSEAIVWGGGSTLDFYRSGGRYDPAIDTWSPTSISVTPSARYHATSQWTGAEVLIWGGEAYPEVALDGGSYLPATDEWSPVATNPNLTGTSGPTSVWTGSEFLIWGGKDFLDIELRNGGRYSPLGDHWEDIPEAGAPSPRQFHSAVWTGTAMIIWGGYNHGPGVLGDGGSYVPGGAWTALPTPSGFAARRNHSAVWANDEMIIWGGYASGALGDGDRYFPPPANTWVPIGAAAAASPRYNHAAVWTGSEMIVWGGYLSADALGDGKRYRPDMGTWVTLATDQAPSQRRADKSVWTGAEMIVWGDNGIGIPPSGARYIPAFDSWQPTSTIGAPTTRIEHVARQLHGQFFVWGGYAGTASHTSGALYCTPRIFFDGFESHDTSPWSGTLP